MKPIVRTSIISVLITLIVTYLIGAACWFSNHKDNAYCSAIQYEIMDWDERQYLSESELTTLLRSSGLYPVGHKRDEIRTQEIEDAILANPMVRTAQCFAQTNGNIQVQISQRIPLIRIITPAESYFVDTDRKIMPIRSSVRDQVITAEGSIGKRMAANELADFAEWMKDNDYWQERIASILVRSPKDVYLKQNGAEPNILLGELDGYRSKLAKIRKLNERAFQRMQTDKQYKELDARYKGQVIAR